MASHIWIHRQTSLLYKHWGPRLVGKKSRTVLPGVQTPKTTMVSTVWAGTSQGTSQGCGVLLEKPPRAERGLATKGLGEYEPAGAQPLWSKTPRRRKRDTSTERDLTKVREAHQRALAATATLEERIKRLNCSTIRGWQDAHTHSWRCNCWRRRSWKQNQRYCRALWEDSPIHFPMHSPPNWGPETSDNKEAEPPFLQFDLGPPSQLVPEVDCFLQEPASKLREDYKSDSSSEPLAQEHKR